MNLNLNLSLCTWLALVLLSLVPGLGDLRRIALCTGDIMMISKTSNMLATCHYESRLI